MVKGICEAVSSSIWSIQRENPLFTARTKATPIIPKEPAILVIIVRPFLVNKFLKERFKAVKKLIELSFSLRFFFLLFLSLSSIIWSSLTSSSFFFWIIKSSLSFAFRIVSASHVSDSTSPSLNLIILSEYW